MPGQERFHVADLDSSALEGWPVRSAIEKRRGAEIWGNPLAGFSTEAGSAETRELAAC